jgi:diacylglycerol kinase
VSARRTWRDKFRDAIGGLAIAVCQERSFAVHIATAALVIVAAAALRVSLVEWCLLVLCISMVLAAELLNTAIERLASQIDSEHNPALGAALDLASGAVLVVALGTAVAGSLIFGYRLGLLLGWWR